MSAHTESNHRRILTIDETAELLNVSTTLLQRSALADFGPTVYIVDNGFRYGRDEVIEWRDKSWKRDQSRKLVEQHWSSLAAAMDADP